MRSVVVAAAWVATRRFAARSPFATDAGLDPLEWAVVVGHNLFFYVYKTLVPARLGIFYPVPTDSLPAHFQAFAFDYISAYSWLALHGGTKETGKILWAVMI